MISRLFKDVISFSLRLKRKGLLEKGGLSFWGNAFIALPKTVDFMLSTKQNT